MKKYFMLVFLFMLLISVSASDSAKKEPVKATYMERYDDYNAMLTWIEAKYKETRDNKTVLIYEGEFKRIHQAATELYDVLVVEQKSGPYPPVMMLPRVCWGCRCLSYFCGAITAKACATGLSCSSYCRCCGKDTVTTMTNGSPCSSLQGDECWWSVGC